MSEKKSRIVLDGGLTIMIDGEGELQVTAALYNADNVVTQALVTDGRRFVSEGHTWREMVAEAP